MTHIDDVHGIKILRVSGDFNKYTTPDLQKLCHAVTLEAGTRAVVVDFVNVRQVDSASFACMINFIKEHMAKDIRIGIINLKEKDQDMLEILRLEKAILTFKCEKEAIENVLNSASKPEEQHG